MARVILRRLGLFVCAAALIFSLAGCGEKSLILNYDLPASPKTLDPQAASDWAAQVVIHNVYEGLLELSATGEPQLAAAKSFTKSEDGLVYDFELREDARWSYYEPDASSKEVPLTADDFVFAFHRLFSPNTNSPGAGQFTCLKNATAIQSGELSPQALGVTATGPHSLRFELERPNALFLELLTTTYASPCYEPFFQGTMGRYGLAASTVLSNGPFRVAHWESGGALRLVKNENYWSSDTVLPKEVRLNPGALAKGEPGTLERLEKGEADAALIDGQTDGLLGHGYQTEPLENAVWGIWLNQKNPILANENIRLAIATAFDRSAYGDDLPPNLSVAEALLPHDIMVSGRSYRAKAGDAVSPAFAPEEAYERYKAGLAELGKGGVDELRLLVDKTQGTEGAAFFAKVSQVLQRELSLFINIELVGASDYSARLASGNFDLALCRFSSSDSSPWGILSHFLSTSPLNFSGYADAEYDRLVGESMARPEDALALCAQAERRLLASGVFLPMYYSTDYFVVRPGIQGIDYNKRSGLVDFRSAREE